ncbi:MAG: TIGR03943 family protein [Anaerolineae bacterium]|nr:TIGR03943 family protein [Anaerolineae bacterium]
MNAKPVPYWQDWLKTLLLLAMGLYLGILIVTGNLSNYINERFQWLSYVAVLLFLLLGGWSALSLLRQQTTLNYAHARITPAALLLAAIPLLFGLLVPSRPLGVEAVTGGVSLNPVGRAAAAAAYTKPPLERNVLDWLREFAAVPAPAALDNEPVDVIGFVYREPDMTGTQFMLARFTMSCCVADAFAIGMPVEYAAAGELAEGAWVRIRGTLRAGLFEGQMVPIIQPQQVEPVDMPANPYLYS